MVIQIPLSQAGEPAAFAASLEAHRAALEAHRTGRVGIAAPAHAWDHLIERVPQTGPVAARGPDTFVVRAYEIVDDTPKTPEAEQALKVLRETIK